MNPRLMFLFYTLLAASAFFSGCSSGDEHGPGEGVLIRVGGSTLTVREFHEAFEGDITALSALYKDPQALQEERYRTLNRLAEELIILERARELDLRVGDDELTRAIDDFRKDFPDDTFEQTLIENGVSYLVWERGMKRRLLMEKVIRQDVSKGSFQVPLPVDETADTAMDGNGDAPLSAEKDDSPDATKPDAAPPGNHPDVSAQAPLEAAVSFDPEGSGAVSPAPTAPGNKAESEYSAWMLRLKEQYSIEIDWKLWEEIEQEDSEGR